MHRSALSRSYIIEFAHHLFLIPYICNANVTDPVVSNPTESSTLPPSKVQGTPLILVELSHDTIDAMTIEEIRSAMKRVRKYPFSSTKPVRKLFENPKKLQPIIISACPTAKMNCIVDNVLSTDRTSYHCIFQFLDDQAAFNLDFGVNPIPFTLFFSHKIAKEDSVHISQKIRINVNTC